MNKKKLTILLASAAISIGFGGFINPPQSVEAKALVLEEPIKAVRLDALAKIHEFKNIKKNLKEEIMVKIKAAKSEENIKKLLEEAQKIESSKHQVKYTIKYIDDTNKTELKSETKIYFANKNITEKGEKFKGYELISENVKTKTLNIDYNEPIEFHYKKIDINKFKENTTSEIRKMRNIKKSKKDNFMAKISSSTSEETIKEILEEAKKENASKHQVKYTIKYIDDTNNKELKSETKIYFANKNITEKAEKFKKYKLVSPETQSKELNIDDNNVIEFHYKLYDDYISLDNFIKEKVDFEKPLDYENTNFTGKSEELKDYIIKNIYKNSYTIKFKASEEDKNKAYDTLFNKTTKASHVRYARNWETSKTETDIKDVFEYTLKPSYLAVRQRQVETEEKIDEIIKKNKVTEMSDFQKAQFIHDYIINKSTQAPGSWMTEQGNNVHETPALILDGKGVCEAYAMTFNRLAERAGLESKMVFGRYDLSLGYNKNYRKKIEEILKKPKFDKKINHAWNKVKIDGKWYNIDTYHDDFRFELASKENLLRKDYYGSIEFLKSDEHFKKSNKIWNPDYVEEAKEDYKLEKNHKIITNFK